MNSPSFASGIFFAVLTGLCWSFLAIGLKYAVSFASSGTIVWIRMIVAATLIILYAAIRKPERLKKVFFRPPLCVILASLFLAFNYYGFMKSVELTSASNAQIMIQTGPLSLLLIGVLYFGESLRKIQWLGILMACMGFVFFNWDQLLVSVEQSATYISGNIWVFFAAITWALYATLQKVQFQKGWCPQEINTLVFTICSVALLFTVNPKELLAFSAWEWFVLILLGVNTLIAYGSFAEALNRIPASLVSLVISVNPLLTILFVAIIGELGWTFISPEPIFWRGYLGAFLVVSGVAVAVSLRAKPNKLTPRP